MEYRSGLFPFMVSATLWHCIVAMTSFPQNTTESLALRTVVVASSTCQLAGSQYSCNYCTTRRDWPHHIDILRTSYEDSTECSSSVGGDTPVPTDNGTLFIDMDSKNCSYSKSDAQLVAASTEKGYTISFWLQTQKCDDCHLFKVSSGGKTANLSITKTDGHRHISVESDSSSSNNININTDPSNWTHLVLRFRLDDGLDAYLDGSHWNRYTTTSTWFPTFNASGSIDFDNYKSTTDAVIRILDFRFYAEALTQREIENLFNSSSSPGLSNPPLDCRCPPTHPILPDSSTDNLLICKNSMSDTVPRLQIESHLPIFAIDNDTTTSWVTDETEDAWILLTMDRIYQVDGITIEVNNTVPLFVIIQFKSSIDTEPPDEVTIRPSAGINSITWSAGSTDGIQTRSQLYKRLASSINITLTGHLDSANVYDVVEIQVNRRVNCFGNSLSVTGENCDCFSSTHTIGQDCGTCQDGYYQAQDHFDCPFMCNCTSTPGIKTVDQCNQVGGACLCKTNVEGYHCDSCKHLYYNLTASNPDGCMPCASCYQTGSESCQRDTGVCACKSNVIGPQCDACAANTYGLQDPNFEGCLPCACNAEGSGLGKTESCDTEDGNCTCKQYVTGRKCDMCKPGYKHLDFANTRGCDDCRCNKVGSQDIRSCKQSSGQCLCLYPVTGNPQCNPMFDSETLEPAFGPVAGGTEVTIKGKFFKHNSDNTQVNVLLTGQTKFLNTKTLEENNLVFITDSSSDSGQYNIKIQWPSSVGMAAADFSKIFTFTFKPNPVITEPLSATVFRSGGCYVKIKGSNFGSVFQTRLIAHTGSNEVLGRRCTMIGESMINCPSPDLRNYTGLSTVRYGLHLDGLDMYRDLNSFPGATITVLDDPMVDTNNDLTIDNIFSNTLVIKGSNFDKACEDNFEIKLGDDVCPIESKTSTEVTCSPVITFPGESGEVELKVIIGNFQSTVGFVKIKSFWTTYQFIIIAASVGGCILLIIIIVIIVKCCRRCHTNSLKDRKTSSSEGLVEGVDLVSLTSREPDIRSSTQRVSQFDRIGPPIVAEQVDAIKPRHNNYTDMSGMPLSNMDSEESIVEKFLHKLDTTLREEVNSSLSKRSIIKLGIRCTQKGAEIRVIDGQFQEGPFQGQNATIKTIVAEFKDFGEDLLPKWIGTGLAETLRFRDCYQENLHRSCGITIDESRFYVLYPTTQRILKEHLRDKKQEFTSFSLIEICQRVAEAMDYLSCNDIVHRDIATRNCVVCTGDVIKITDAAFSWSLFPDEYMYDSDRERWLPVRWMAQESLQAGFYSTSTDVWSYGVLMWEVMSRGVLLPYFDIEINEDIKNHVISGYRLGRPETVPDEMYNLMRSCWETNHNSRPAFVRVIERLIDILEPPESPTMIYQNQNQQQEELPEYGNVPDNRPKLPSRANMPAKNGNVNFGYKY